MKDKELRDLFVKRNELFDIELSYLKQQINDLKKETMDLKDEIKQLNDQIYKSTVPYSSSFWGTNVVDPMTLKGYVCKLQENQKAIIDYLGIEKVEEPPKTYMRKKTELKINTIGEFGVTNER